MQLLIFIVTQVLLFWRWLTEMKLKLSQNICTKAGNFLTYLCYKIITSLSKRHHNIYKSWLNDYPD